MNLICFSLMISDIEHLFYTCWISVCLHWKNVYSGPLPILKIRLSGFFAIELYEFPLKHFKGTVQWH